MRTTPPIDLDIDILPKFHVSSCITLPHTRLRKFAIQPRVHRRRQHAHILFLMTEGHLAIGKRTLFFRAARWTMVVAVEPA